MTNAMAPIDPYSAGMDAAPTEMTQVGLAQAFRIRRRGARPLSFHGSELAMAMSYTPDLPYWYEINIYRTGQGRFALAVRLFFQDEDRRDRVDAWTFEALEDLIAHLEAYDAGADVAISADMPPTGAAPAELAAAALHMKSEIAAARQHFAGLVGELLSEVDGAAERL